jgi:peptidoglycan/LPS O-acetylase OafA/YrhL
MKIEPGRIDELDGLRGIAIASVLLFHLDLLAPTPLPWLNRVMLFGWSGVDLFFVLSGFLIGGILIDNRSTENYFTVFYARRFFRIIPVYYLLIGLYFGFYVVGGGLRSDLVGWVGAPMPPHTYLTFTTNFWIAKHNFMEAFASPTWSLAIEEQFYLALPLLVRVVKPKFLPATVLALIGSIAGFRMGMCLAHAVTQIQCYVLSCFRADALMIGVGCALAVRSEAVVEFITRRSWVLYAALLAFGSMIVSSGGRLLPDPAAPINTYGLTVVALFFATVMLIAILLPHHPISKALRFRPLRSLGKLAYCVYLLHVSILLVTFRMLSQTAVANQALVRWTAGIAGISVVIMIASVSWKYFESRMIRLGHRFKYSSTPSEKRQENLLPLAS